MTSNALSKKKALLKPPPYCTSKPPIIIPPLPIWPPLTLTALVHWYAETPGGDPIFDVTAEMSLTRVDEGNRYEGETAANGHELILNVDFNGFGPPADVFTRINKPGEYTFDTTKDVDIELTQPFAPPTFRLYVMDWFPRMWCDITLTAP